jgi:hypothetical protein
MAGYSEFPTTPIHIDLWVGGNTGYRRFHNPGYKLLGKLFQKGGAAHASMLDILFPDCGSANTK